MRVVVLGAGIAGITTACSLSEQGHDVTVIDRARAVAAATSHANGAQLSYSYSDALAQPAFLSKIPGLVLGHDPAIRIGRRDNAFIVPWGLSFLRQCTAQKARSNTLAVLDLALESAKLLEALRNRVPIDFAWRRVGKLAVIGREDDVEGARERAGWKRERGCDVRIVSYEEALELEPALEHMEQRFAAAVYSPDDEVGDACAFAKGLADWLVAHRGLELRLGVTANEIVKQSGAVTAVRTDAGDIEADAIVVCLGPWSPALLDPLGLRLKIYPIRGYSITLPIGEAPPLVSITNIENRIVFSLLGAQVRIAAFADFVGYDTRRDAERIGELREVARRIAPLAANYEADEDFGWGGFRPVTPDSRPLVGPTAIRGLFLNCGHGVLGWTLAPATAERIANAVSSSA